MGRADDDPSQGALFHNRLLALVVCEGMAQEYRDDHVFGEETEVGATVAYAE